MTAFEKYLRSIVEQAANEASKDGSAAFEAQHLLLAIAAEREPTTRAILRSVGLDYRAIRHALHLEFEHSLKAAGMSLAAFALPEPSSPNKHPGPGASARLALERGFASAGRKKDLRPAHLLLGITQAEVGTVPRALAMASIDRTDLRARAMRAITNETA
jgi:D-alanyl-D-alanine carboxypeptidase